MKRLIALYKWFKDLKTGYHVAIYDCETRTWVRADCIGGDRYVIRDGNLELRTSARSGYEACLQGRAWFDSLRNT